MQAKHFQYGLSLFILFIKVLVVSAKTFVFTGVFWANGNFNLPGVPSDTDHVIITNNLCIINSGVHAECNNLTITNDEVFIQKNGSLTVHGQLFIRPSNKVSGIIISESASLTTLKDVHFESFTIPERATISLSDVKAEYNYYGSFKFSPMGSIWGENGSTIIGKGNRSLPTRHCHYHDIVIHSENSIQLGGNLGSGNGAGQFDGSLIVEKGVFSTNNYQIVGSSNESFEVKSGAAAVFTDTKGVPTEFSNIVIEDHTTIGFHRIGNQDITPLSYWNLSVSGIGIKELTDSTFVNGELTVNSGNLNLKNYLTLSSNKKGTGSLGYICPSCNVVDSFKTERYLPNYVDSTQLLFSGWVKGAKLSGWADDIDLKGFPGSAFPSAPSSSIQFFSTDTFNSTGSGWFNPKSINDSISLFDGVLFQPEFQDSFKLDLFGPSTKGPISFALNNAQTKSIHLVGNPYSSAVKIDLNHLQSTGVFNPSTIDQFGNLIPLDHGDTLHLGESMFIQTIAANASIEFRETDKVGSPGINGISRSTHKKAGNGAEMVLTLHREDGSTDQLFIQAQNGSYTAGYDQGKDFIKLPNIFERSMIYNKIDGEKCALNKIPFNIPFASKFPIHVEKPNPTPGLTRNYQLEINNVSKFLNRNLCPILENKTNGQLIILESDTIIPFSVNDNFTQAAFELSLSNLLETSPQNVTCKGDSNGRAISIGQGTQLSFWWFNEKKDTLQYALNTVGRDSIESLAPGNYSVLVKGNPQCQFIGDQFSISEPPTEVISNFSISKTNVDLQDTGLVIFQNQSVGANNYEWWLFPDSIFSTDTNTHFLFEIQGKYEIGLIAAFENCKDTSIKKVNVIHSSIGEILNKNKYSINAHHNGFSIKSDKKGIFTVELINAVGKTLIKETVVFSENELVNFFSNNAAGLYWVRITNEAGSYFSKQLYIRSIEQ